jgi:hypothetical protein
VSPDRTLRSSSPHRLTGVGNLFRGVEAPRDCELHVGLAAAQPHLAERDVVKSHTLMFCNEVKGETKAGGLRREGEVEGSRDYVSSGGGPRDDGGGARLCAVDVLALASPFSVAATTTKIKPPRCLLFRMAHVVTALAHQRYRHLRARGSPAPQRHSPGFPLQHHVRRDERGEPQPLLCHLR